MAGRTEQIKLERTSSVPRIPLKILIIDSEFYPGTYLKLILEDFDIVREVQFIHGIENAFELLNNFYNVIYLDPLNLSVWNSSNFVTNVRNNFPEIVYVLFSDIDKLLEDKYVLFGGHNMNIYFKLDKKTPLAELKQQIQSNISLIQWDFDIFASQKNNQHLLERLSLIANESKEKGDMLNLAKSIKNLLKENEIEKSLNILNVYFENLNKYDSNNFIILQQAAFTRINRQFYQGLIEQEQYDIGMSKIINAILNIAIKEM